MLSQEPSAAPASASGLLPVVITVHATSHFAYIKGVIVIQPWRSIILFFNAKENLCVLWGLHNRCIIFAMCVLLAFALYLFYYIAFVKWNVAVYKG